MFVEPKLIQECRLLVCLFEDCVSAPRSFPAKSINENLPWTLFATGLCKMIWKTACDRDELLLADVWPEVLPKEKCIVFVRLEYSSSFDVFFRDDERYLAVFPRWIILNTSSTFSTMVSVRPTTWTCCLPSSSTRNFALSANRSNTCGHANNNLD